MKTMRQALADILAEAGAFMLRRDHFSSLQAKAGHANYVTNVDRELQAFLQQRLALLCPGSRFIGEETQNEPLTDDPTWVVDPLDGTTNFIHDYQCSAISAALVVNRQPHFGCIYQPYLGQMFSAERGKGAFLNEQPMHVSNHPMDRALVGFGTSPYLSALARPGLELARRFLERAADIRRCGSAAVDLAYVASGRQDVFFELTLKPWDFAAGALLVTEAGGVFDMPLLEQADIGRPSTVLAANPQCIREAREMVLDTLREYCVDQDRLDALNAET